MQFDSSWLNKNLKFNESTKLPTSGSDGKDTLGEADNLKSRAFIFEVEIQNKAVNFVEVSSTAGGEEILYIWVG